MVLVCNVTRCDVGTHELGTWLPFLQTCLISGNAELSCKQRSVDPLFPSTLLKCWECPCARRSCQVPGPSQVGLLTVQGTPGDGDLVLLPRLLLTYCKRLRLSTPSALQNDKPTCGPVGQNESWCY